MFAAVSQLRRSWDVLMLHSVLQPWWLLLVKSYLRIYCCYSVKQSVKNFSDWPLKIGAIGCPETLVRNYHSQNSVDLAEKMSWKPRFHQSTVCCKPTLIITYSSKNLHLLDLYLFPYHRVYVHSTIHLQHLQIWISKNNQQDGCILLVISTDSYCDARIHEY